MWPTIPIDVAVRLTISALDCLQSYVALTMEEPNVSSMKPRDMQAVVTARTTPPLNTYLGLGLFRAGGMWSCGLAITLGSARWCFGLSRMPTPPVSVEVVSSSTATRKPRQAKRRVVASSSIAQAEMPLNTTASEPSS